jgi:hypothetical protein
LGEPTAIPTTSKIPSTPASALGTRVGIRMRTLACSTNASLFVLLLASNCFKVPISKAGDQNNNSNVPHPTPALKEINCRCAKYYKSRAENTTYPGQNEDGFCVSMHYETGFPLDSHQHFALLADGFASSCKILTFKRATVGKK